ncbi:phage distal tail protein [Nonomuraea wenchangensis]|uniref:phage distal tail protein n=1 Tax=Nonomuraea wenchangensis TaxID=568860 RepID=UPI00332D968D
MARSGRSYTNQPVLSRHPRDWDRSLDLPAFESVSEWPPLVVDTPNVNLLLPAFESVSEWPDLVFVRDQTLTLPAFESISEWPALTVSVPPKPGDALTGVDGQVDWNGTLWGAGTDVAVLLPVDGWLATPNIDNGNVARPNRHGAWDARKFAQQRIVSLRLQPNSATDPSQVWALINDVLAVTGIPESEDPLPLVIKAYGPPLLAYGQVVDRPLVLDGDYNAGLPTIGLVIACADPRLYGLEPRGATVPVNSATGLSNSGNAATHPLIRLEGPVTDPLLTNTTLRRSLRFDITVADGDTLEIDTNNGTVTLAGENAMSALTGITVPVQDFVLAAGSNTLQYTAAAGGANGADFLWRDATL